MIKIKDAGNGYRTRLSCDENGKETSRTASFNEKSPLWAESEKWLKDNEILPQYTAEELSEKEADEAADAIESTQSTCISYLNDSEIHVSNDPPYPENVQDWKDKRAEWRTILKSGTAQDVPNKPYGE